MGPQQTWALRFADRWQGLAAHALLLLLVLGMWWPALFHGMTLIHGDSLIHGLPLLEFLRSYLHGGESPLWVHEIFGGHPLFAESQGAFAQPLNILVAALAPPVFGINLFHACCMLLGAVGVIRLCRILGSSVAAATLAAVATVFSSAWITQQHNLTIAVTLAWVPWAFCALEYWLKQPDVTRSVWMALAGLMLILAGYPQVTHGVILFAAVSFIALPFSAHGRRTLQAKWKPLVATAALAAILCIGLSAFQLFPLIELTRYSHRSAGTSLQFQAPLSVFVRGMLFIADGPRVVGGLGSVLVCALASAACIVPTPHRIKGYVLASLFLLMLGMGDVTSLFQVIYAAHLIPGLHYFRTMAAYLNVAIVGFSVLAAFAADGLARLGNRTSGTNRLLRLGLVAVLAIAWCALAAKVWMPGLDAVVLALPVFALAGALALTLFHRSRWVVFYLLVAVTAGSVLLRLHQLKFHDASFLAKRTLVDSLVGASPHDYKIMNASMIPAYGMLSSRFPGLDELAHKAMAADVGLSNLRDGVPSMNGALALQLHERAILAPELEDELQDRSGVPAPGLRLIDILGVRHVTADHAMPTPAFQVAAHDQRLGLWVMRNTAAQPLFQLYTHVVAVASEEQALQKLRNARKRQLVLVDTSSADLPPDAPTCDAAHVHWQITKQQSSSYSVVMHSPGACWLFLADANYPGWQASIDGTPTRVWTAQVLGKAVHVPAGNHTIKIRFRSPSFRIGLAVSLLTVLLMLGLLVGCAVRHARNSRLTDT